MFYSHFAALGPDIVVEDVTHHDRIDMAVILNAHVYLFEFKVVELVPEGHALEQIREKGYGEKYKRPQQNGLSHWRGIQQGQPQYGWFWGGEIYMIRKKLLAGFCKVYFLMRFRVPFFGMYWEVIFYKFCNSGKQ